MDYGNSNDRKIQHRLARVWQVVTARQVLLYLALDISIVGILCIFDPIIRYALAQMPLWYWPLVYVPFILLTRFENPNVPLVFNKGGKKRTIAAWTLLI
jgi:hypothetical protein